MEYIDPAFVDAMAGKIHIYISANFKLSGSNYPLLYAEYSFKQ